VGRLNAALDELEDAVNEWAELLADNFKAPEQKVGLPARVATAAWNTTVEYEVMKRLSAS
jgi:hypothetical protein